MSELFVIGFKSLTVKFCNFFFEMVYLRSYRSHLDISMTICPHQMAAVGFELTTLRFRGMAPSVRTGITWIQIWK